MNPKCEQPGCPQEMEFKPTYVSQNGPDEFSTSGFWICPATPEEHRLYAKVAELEAKLAEADFCIAWQADPSDGTDPRYMGRKANLRGYAAQDAAIAREAERNPRVIS